MPAGLHFAGVHGKLVVDIDENSHPGTEFRVSAGGNFEGGVMKSRQRYWRAGQSLPEQKPDEAETGRG